MSGKYSGLRGLVNQFLNEETSLTREDIENRIYSAYSEDSITGREYDKLMAMLDGF